MTSRCGCGADADENQLSRDCDEAQRILWAERALARLKGEPMPEVPEWITYSVCVDAMAGV